MQINIRFRLTSWNFIGRADIIKCIQNSFEKDNGMLSYVVLSFNSPTERANFMKMFGYGFEERYIDGKEFMDRIEFGAE